MSKSELGTSPIAQRHFVPWLALRSALFYLGFVPFMIVYASISLLVASWLPYRARFAVVVAGNHVHLWWLRLTCGVRWEVVGAEHLVRQRSCVLMANHQSEWETIFLQVFVGPLCTVLKKELLRIPFFGWALRLLQPIAIDRSRRAGAVKQLLQQGKQRLDQGIPVLIFPQGTRVPAGKLGRFNKGGSMLACSAGVPVVRIAHNAGEHWPSGQFLKYPGMIRVEIAPLLETEGLSVDEVQTECEAWFNQRLGVTSG